MDALSMEHTCMRVHTDTYTEGFTPTHINTNRQGWTPTTAHAQFYTGFNSTVSLPQSWKETSITHICQQLPEAQKHLEMKKRVETSFENGKIECGPH